MTDIGELLCRALHSFEGNRITAGEALRPELCGLVLFDDPIFGVADAADPLWGELRASGLLGPDHALPGDFLPGARRVVSFFLPYSEEVLAACREGERPPVLPYLHVQAGTGRVLGHLRRTLAEALGGVAPALTPLFHKVGEGSSNWSERHAGYIGGLGTFGANGFLITRKGCAGRLGSVVTPLNLPVTARAYEGPFDWCTFCGACARRCPASAISLSRVRGEEKSLSLCRPLLSSLAALPGLEGKNGCGFCQTGIPCARGVPAR